MQRVGWGLSDIGRVRTSNEDSFLVDDALGLYVVADGMGGHSAGDVASREAVEATHSMVLRQAPAVEALDSLERGQLCAGGPLPLSLRRAVRIVESAVQAATYMVYGLSQTDPRRRGMGTTLSALLLRGHYAVSGQVGDSRIYLVRDNRVIQLTEDHTLVAWQIKRGLISAEDAKRSQQQHVITRAVGSRDYVQVDVRPTAVDPGDRFLLCSDGLHGYLAEAELLELAANDPGPAAVRAVELANARGGKDNITAVFVSVV